jgi:hypothetical protein
MMLNLNDIITTYTIGRLYYVPASEASVLMPSVYMLLP